MRHESIPGRADFYLLFWQEYIVLLPFPLNYERIFPFRLQSTTTHNAEDFIALR